MALLQGEMRVGVQSLHLLLPQQAPSPAERTPRHSEEGEGGWRRAEAVLPGATLPSIRTKPPQCCSQRTAELSHSHLLAMLPCHSHTPQRCARHSHTLLRPAG